MKPDQGTIESWAARVTPVSPEPTHEARRLLGLLYAITGHGIFTGQHNQPVHGSSWSEEVHKITGSYPALWGQEFGFSPTDTLDGINFRDRNIEQAIDWHKRGSVICFTWHAVSPLEDEPVDFQGGIIKDISQQDWEEMLTPGSRLNARWCAQVDVIAALLKRLQAENVPVLWRPYHEMNGTWFWWGGNIEGFKRLWRMMFEYLTFHHGLRNLVWVYNPNAAYGNNGAIEDYYPGHDVVDVLALDTYDNHFELEHYTSLLELAAGKPIGWGEVGNVPSAELICAQPNWTWFMVWSAHLTSHNSPELVQKTYGSDEAITLKDLNGWQT